jgi:hypothetical protein
MLRLPFLRLAAGLLLLSPLAARAEPRPPSETEEVKKAKDKARMSMDELGDPTKGRTADRGALLSLQFFDALTANPIPGARVGFLDQTVTTDERGIAQFPFPKIEDREDVTMYAVFRKDGKKVRRGGANVPESERSYVPAKVPIQFAVGTVIFNRYSVSPALDPGKLRIVLEWGDAPADLDAHLVKQGEFHVSFRNMKNYKDQVFLDRDDTDQYGPETITIEDVDASGRYDFFVHDWTNQNNAGSHALAKSKARVMVFDAEGLVASYFVPDLAGTAWTAFHIVDGRPEAAGQMLPAPAVAGAGQ